MELLLCIWAPKIMFIAWPAAMEHPVDSLGTFHAPCSCRRVKRRIAGQVLIHYECPLPSPQLLLVAGPRAEAPRKGHHEGRVACGGGAMQHRVASGWVDGGEEKPIPPLVEPRADRVIRCCALQSFFKFLLAEFLDPSFFWRKGRHGFLGVPLPPRHLACKTCWKSEAEAARVIRPKCIVCMSGCPRCR